ncbi:MAG: NAD(P)-dependent oxidoreductase, partial [Maritimibacter sp.]|nr:NAD(P)-dependent oxidoreductase [Maritimibacter sp.]
MRILFTGGSGKAGREVVPYLLDRGHRVMNVDLVPLDDPRVDNITADLTDGAQVFNVMSMYADFDELEPGTGVPRFDAVVHFAAVPRILLKPDNETYRINVLSTYNVLEAATKLGIRKVVIASSETTYGVCFADGER